MGKKGRRCKTRWRRLPMGGEAEEEEEDCPSALGGREKGKGGEGASSPLHNKAHAPYKGGVGGQRGKVAFGRRSGGSGTVTDSNKKGAAGGATYTFNEDEYTKITTPRQDVLFKKGYLMARRKDPPTSTTPSSTETTNGEANGTSAPLNGDASSSSDQTYSAQVSGSGEDESGGCNGYQYMNGFTNGLSYGGGYHMDHAAAANGGAYFINGGGYEIYDPYATAAGYAFPYVGAPPPHPPPPHTLPPLHAMDWYTSRPLNSTANVGDVQWCHLVANPGYSEMRRKRYSTDSQNCSPPSSESTGPPGSPQEEGGSSGDHTHQPIPQYHHAHVFHPPAATAAYVYPGYLFGPAVYSVNGVSFPPVHPLHGISQSIHVHPSAAAASPVPQGAVPVAPGSDGGSQRRRKKKRRRKRRRGLTDEASEETSSEAGEEEGIACGDEDYDGEDGPVVVVRLGNVGSLVMNQPQIGSPLPFPKGEGGRDAEASSTDCSELSGQPESSSGAEESIPVGELEDRGTQVEDEEMFKGVLMRDVEVSTQRDLLLLEIGAEKEVTMNADTKEVSTQSPPEMAVQVNVPVTSLPSPVSPVCQMQLPETPMEKAINDNNVEEVKEGKEEQTKEKQKEGMAVQKETPKQKRRNGGRGKNDNKHPSPSPKAATLLEKEPESEPVSVYIEKMEVFEPLLAISNSTELDPNASKISALGETFNKVLEEDVSLQPPSVEKKVDIDMFPGISLIAPDIPEKKEDLQNSTPKIIPEQKVEPPETQCLDSFVFKPEPYKHPMLKPSKQEMKEDPILSEGNTVPKEVNSECTKVEKVEKSPTEEKPSLLRHTVDMPKRRTRLKEPPEKEEVPETQVLLSNEVMENTSEPEMKNTISLEDGRKEGEIDNKPLGSEDLLADVVEPAGDKEDSEIPAETLTEVVSKWLEENLDALPDTTKEIMEKTEEENEAEEENLTGSKNGVGNPFPVPSSRLFEEMKSNECKCENVDEHECVSYVCASAIRKDGPVKRVANRKIGEVNKSKDKYDEDGRRQSEESDESCEWEPMTVEVPKKNFGDLETWKRLRSGMGGSSEAIRSLGSYRGTDDEEEDEMRKVRESMCDPNASVAKYYCLGSRDIKSVSPEEGPAQSDIPVQTDSGVQSDVEDDSVATAEEAFEESMAKGKTALRGVGLGKTAAFFVRQIGTADAAKGPFPCGICCIIQ